MTRFRIVAVLVFGVLALAGVSFAQVFGVRPVTPMVLSGADLGFRIEGMRGSTPVGTLVVRVNGQWVETDFQVGPRSLGSK